MSTPRELALKFITQAVDPAATEQEARTFAFKAAKLIAEHKLLDGAVGFGNIGDFLKRLPLERIMRDAGTVAIAASTVEIMQLKGDVVRLKAENERLHSKLRRRRR